MYFLLEDGATLRRFRCDCDSIIVIVIRVTNGNIQRTKCAYFKNLYRRGFSAVAALQKKKEKDSYRILRRL